MSDQRLRPEPGQLLAAYHDIHARMWAARADTCRRFATCYLVARAMAKWHAVGAPTWSATGDVPVSSDYFAVCPSMPGASLEQIADHWAESLRLMQALSNVHSTAFLAIVQPNQWVRATTPYKARYLDTFTEYVMRVVPLGYRALLARIPTLHAQGEAVLDETELFDTVGSDVYLDDCCHFVPAGNAMLVEEIAKWLAER